MIVNILRSIHPPWLWPMSPLAVPNDILFYFEPAPFLGKASVGWRQP
jgi:hypothetical protein